MKTLRNHLQESLKKFPRFSLNDMIETGVWIPNDDITSQEYDLIKTKFDKTFTRDLNGICWIAGEPVSCIYSKQQPMVDFLVWTKTLSDKELGGVIETIADFLTNVIYSVCGGDAEIKNLIKKIK